MHLFSFENTNQTNVSIFSNEIWEQFTLAKIFFIKFIQDGLFWGCYNDEIWHSYTLPKEDPKNI